MKRLVLKSNHEVVKKLDRLVNLADELGISLEFAGGNCTLYHGNEAFEIEDTDSKENVVTNFPPVFEYKVMPRSQ